MILCSTGIQYGSFSDGWTWSPIDGFAMTRAAAFQDGLLGDVCVCVCVPDDEL